MAHKKRNIILIAAFAVVVVVVLSIMWVFRKAPDNVSSQKAVFETQATELVNAYNADEAASDQKFLGKVISVSGQIESFTENTAEKKVSVILKSPGEMSGVICEFASGYIDTKALQTGSEIKVKGICNGFLMDVVLTKCVLDE